MFRHNTNKKSIDQNARAVKKKGACHSCPRGTSVVRRRKRQQARPSVWSHDISTLSALVVMEPLDGVGLVDLLLRPPGLLVDRPHNGIRASAHIHESPHRWECLTPAVGAASARQRPPSYTRDIFVEPSSALVPCVSKRRCESVVIMEFLRGCGFGTPIKRETEWSVMKADP